MKKIHLLLNCRSRRETVVIGGKEWDLNLRVQNSCLSPFPMCQDMWPSCPLSSQLIKNEGVIAPCYLDVLSWGQKHLTLVLVLVWFFFPSSVEHSRYFSHLLACFCGQAEAGLGLWLYRHRVTLVTYWIIVSSSSQPAGVRLTVPMGWGVGIWQLTYITFSVIFVLMRNWAEDKAENISLKWRWPPLSKIGPIPVLLFYSSYYFLTVCVWRYFLPRWKSLSRACSALSVLFKELSALWVTRNNEPHLFLQLSVKLT